MRNKRICQKNGTVTRENVFTALNVAQNNGYDLKIWSAQEIADDLATYDSDFDECDPEILIPFIQEWLQVKNRINDFEGRSQ